MAFYTCFWSISVPEDSQLLLSSWEGDGDPPISASTSKMTAISVLFTFSFGVDSAIEENKSLETKI